MLVIAAYLFGLPDMDFAVNYSDEVACHRPWLSYVTEATVPDCAGFLMPGYDMWGRVRLYGSLEHA